MEGKRTDGGTNGKGRKGRKMEGDINEKIENMSQQANLKEEGR